MPLTVRLDAETEQCLADLQAETGQDRSALVRQLIRERWQTRQQAACISERLGGHPEQFLETLEPGSAERSRRQDLLHDRLQVRRTARH
jgi:non-ribosomal peptide synthetase component F